MRYQRIAARTKPDLISAGDQSEPTTLVGDRGFSPTGFNSCFNDHTIFNSSLARMDMRSGVQGGSHTSSTLTDSTPAT